jgi:hypothetical protein
MPLEALLRRSRDSIPRWRDAACPDRQDIVATRFSGEAFAATGLQRLRLRLDRGAPEWPGRTPVAAPCPSEAHASCEAGRE